MCPMTLRCLSIQLPELWLHHHQLQCMLTSTMSARLLSHHWTLLAQSLQLVVTLLVQYQLTPSLPILLTSLQLQQLLCYKLATNTSCTVYARLSACPCIRKQGAAHVRSESCG